MMNNLKMRAEIESNDFAILRNVTQDLSYENFLRTIVGETLLGFVLEPIVTDALPF